uniref:PIR Superfamily Protein n=1 Tax=Meloidogyne hapla TaxID=6305 RepID=A0A1I8B4K1_MELHA
MNAKECFDKNKTSIIENKKETILSVKKILDKIKGHYLHDKYQDMLEKQSICLTNFLFKKYGNDHLIHENVPNYKNVNEKNAITFYHKIFWNENYYSFRWEWKGSDKLPELKFEKGTAEHDELTKCNDEFMPPFRKKS